MSKNRKLILFGIIVFLFLCLPGLILVGSVFVKSGKFNKLVQPKVGIVQQGPGFMIREERGTQAMPCGCTREGHHPIGKGHQPVNLLEQTAVFLDMNYEELAKAYRGGQKISDIVSGKGKNADELKQNLSGQIKTHLDQQVKIGRLTQDQANEIQTYRDKQIDNFIYSWPL